MKAGLWRKPKNFLKTYLDLDDETLQTIYEDVLFNPTNYMVYGIGMDEIQELKTNARDNLGESFDIKEFHREFLDLGPAPFLLSANICRKLPYRKRQTKRNRYLPFLDIRSFVVYSCK